MKEKLRSLKTWQKFVLVFVGIWVFFGVVKALGGGEINESVAQEEIGNSANEQYSNRKTAESESDKQVEQESIEAQAKAEEESNKNALEADLNEHINGMISEAQGYFNPDDPNTYQFASSMYINEVQFDTSSNDIYVSVNNDFLSLSDSDKTDVMNSAQNLTIGALLEKEYDLTTSEKQGMFTTVLNGQNTVGSSKVLDVREYTWY